MTTLIRVAPSSIDLATLVPFVDCTAEQIAHLRQLSELVRIAAGESVIRDGELVDRLFVVVSGTLRVHNDSGLDHLLGAGDVVGEMSLVRGTPATADVEAAEECDLLTFDAAATAVLLGIDPVARRLRAIVDARHTAPAHVAVEAAWVPVVVPPPLVRGVGAGLHSRSELPARPVRLVVLAAVALVLGSVFAYVMTQRNVATVVDLEDVLAQARENSTTTTNPVSPAAPVTSPQVGPGDAPGPTPSGAADSDPAAPEEPGVDQPAPPAVVPGPGGDTVAERDEHDEATTDPAAPRFRLPAAGVYSYATTGGDRINIAGARHQYPDVTHAVLEHTEGCGWGVEHHVLEEHITYHDRCTEADGVSVVADGRDVEFFGQRDGLIYRCDPPARTLWDAPAGTVSTGVCSTEDGGSDAHFRGTRVGFETLEVGGKPVETVHIHIDFEMTGDARGTSTVDFWLHPETGLIVREERVVDTYARAVWGDVRYQEEATFHLLSLTPRA